VDEDQLNSNVANEGNVVRVPHNPLVNRGYREGKDRTFDPESFKEQVIRLPNPMLNSPRTGKPSIEDLNLPALNQEILTKIVDWLRIKTFTK